MKTQNISIQYADTQYVGFDFLDLPLPAAMLVASQQIDEAADAARLAVVGDPLRVFEYQQAAAEAGAFKAARYEGVPPRMVQSWANVAEVSPQAAADDILTRAATWQDALYEIRDARQLGKAQVRKGSDHDGVRKVAESAIAAIRKTAAISVLD